MSTIEQWFRQAPLYTMLMIISIGVIANMFVTWYRASKLGDAICNQCGNRGPLSTAGLAGEKIVCKKCKSTDWVLVDKRP